MSGATFGRKGAAPSVDLAARRAAFLAEERARAQAAPAPAPTGGTRAAGIDDGFSRPPLTERPFVSRKTMGTAYLLWFFLGGLSAHRFYLGFRVSAIIQMLLTPLGYAMLLSKSPAGLLLVPAAGLWILVDVFLIPGMVTKANERARELSYASTFA
jgi:TM2 domain-containing membrane protein YozV